MIERYTPKDPQCDPNVRIVVVNGFRDGEYIVRAVEVEGEKFKRYLTDPLNIGGRFEAGGKDD